MLECIDQCVEVASTCSVLVEHMSHQDHGSGFWGIYDMAIHTACVVVGTLCTVVGWKHLKIHVKSLKSHGTDDPGGADCCSEDR